MVRLHFQKKRCRIPLETDILHQVTYIQHKQHNYCVQLNYNRWWKSVSLSLRSTLYFDTSEVGKGVSVTVTILQKLRTTIIQKDTNITWTNLLKSNICDSMDKGHRLGKELTRLTVVKIIEVCNSRWTETFKDCKRTDKRTVIWFRLKLLSRIIRKANFCC